MSESVFLYCRNIEFFGIETYNYDSYNSLMFTIIVLVFLQGKFEESAKFVERSYELTKKMEKNDEKKDLVRTEYGIVSANLILFGVSQSMENTASENIKKLLDWKQSRENTFVASMSKYLPVEKLEYER